MYFTHRRQQWSVGHGFFHSASVGVGGALYRYIYDCGGHNEFTVNREIDRYAINENMEDNGKAVDMLVISHFHADHIKGIPYLLKQFRIKNLVIPYLSEDAKALVLAYFAAIGVDEWNVFSGLILAPEDWLANLESDAQVVQISAEDGDRLDEATVPPNGNGLAIGTGVTNQSTPAAIFVGTLPVWRFKFHVEENPKYVAAILNEIATQLRLDMEQLKASLRDSNWINANWETLKKCFKSIGSENQNATNLSMFSGPIRYVHLKRASFQPKGRDYAYWCYREDRLGWLGTGDAELKKSAAYSSFESSFEKYLPNLDTVTVPHHGSRRDYNAQIGDLGLRHVITSNHLVDPKDKHPSSDVMVNLRSKSGAVEIVTDDPSTTLFDSFTGLLRL